MAYKTACTERHPTNNSILIWQLPIYWQSVQIQLSLWRPSTRKKSTIFYSTLANQFPGSLLILESSSLILLIYLTKRAQVYQHRSQTTNNITKPINQLCNVKATKAKIKYSFVLADHPLLMEYCSAFSWCIYWSLWWWYTQSFPTTCSSSKHHKIKNVSLHHSLLLHLGENFGLSRWEPKSNTPSFLVVWLFIHCSHMTFLNV